MTTLVLFFIGGLVILIAGAEFLVRGASRLAAIFGVSPLVIGLTIVAIGTASPEIAVSLHAAASGQGSLMLGNVLGSNIFNILLILGVTAMAAPVLIAEQLIRLDAPIMVGISLLAFGLSRDGNLGFFDGIILLTGLVGYTIFALRQSRKESAKVGKEYAQEFAETESHTQRTLTVNIFLILAGLGLLVLGAQWLVDSATAIARNLGISELVVGLTIVAMGTSLPEAATSIIATLKKESDIAVGNAVGSNIFNLLGVLGLGGLAASGGIPVAERILQFDFPVVLFTAFVCLPMFYIDNRISRLEGALLLSYYILYTAYVALQVMESPFLQPLAFFAEIFVPVTLILLVWIAFRSARRKKKNGR